MTLLDQRAFDFIVDRINLGVLAVDRDYRVRLFNRFMHTYTGLDADEVLGRSLFEVFTDLPEAWLKKKIDAVFILKNYAFTSWQQRPYVFRMTHNRPVTGGVRWMHQNCTFFPLSEGRGAVDLVCIAVEDVTESALYDARLRAAMAEIEHLSVHDGLTGLVNRRELGRRLDEEVRRSRRYGSTCSVMIIDLDLFKEINDSYGHLAGDEVLTTVASILQAAIRDCDTAARYGGDEFVLILPETSDEGAKVMAERIRHEFATTAFASDTFSFSVTLSIGIAQYRRAGGDPLELLADADRALYACKDAGRNGVVVYDPELHGTHDSTAT